MKKICLPIGLLIAVILLITTVYATGLRFGVVNAVKEKAKGLKAKVESETKGKICGVVKNLSGEYNQSDNIELEIRSVPTNGHTLEIVFKTYTSVYGDFEYALPLGIYRIIARESLGGRVMSYSGVFLPV